jgi:hypothetical protein
MLDKSPDYPLVADTACGESPLALPCAIKSPEKPGRGRPDGSTVGPMVRIMRQTHDPNYLAAILALLIRDEHEAADAPITRIQAVDLAIEEFPRRFGPPRQLILTIRTNAAGQRVGTLKGRPAALNRDRIVGLLGMGRVNRTTLEEFRRWQPHVAALPWKITR